jgi:RNA-binding protein
MEVIMLTSKQRSYLRGLANTMQPILQIGKEGVSDNLIKQFVDAMEARELIKVTVLKNAECDAHSFAEKISKLTTSDVVQVIGSKFILYKESTNKKKIELP